MKNANPVSLRHMLVLATALALPACRKADAALERSVPPSPEAVAGGSAAPVRYGYEVVKVWPHDRGAFTQGLVFRNGSLLESTGLNGASTLREVDFEKGRILKQVTVPQRYFAEGLAVLGEKAFQLTWKHEVGFIYDAASFQKQGEFRYSGEGWGLTTDGKVLILSDGTHRIRFLDPTSFAVTRTIEVTLEGRPLNQLNELEWVNGEIFANVWQTDTIVRIDSATGRVKGVIDFAGLLSATDRRGDTDVLNGIAYDAAGDRLFITGKNWPKLFQVKLIKR